MAKRRVEWPADKVERRAVAELLPSARNARTHNEEQVEQIAASIREWGWTNPVLVDEDGAIIAGHGRVLAARKMGLVDVPVMVATGWSDAQKRAYLLTDNKLPENAGWDRELLALELGDLAGAGFDTSLTGFSDKELGDLLDDPDPLRVHEVATTPVADRFWISIRGPLVRQADAVQRLKAAMADLGDVEVELGTTPDE